MVSKGGNVADLTSILDRGRKERSGLLPRAIERVCFCLSVHLRISGTTHPNFTKFSSHVTRGRGSVLL